MHPIFVGGKIDRFGAIARNHAQRHIQPIGMITGGVLIPAHLHELFQSFNHRITVGRGRFAAKGWE